MPNYMINLIDCVPLYGLCGFVSTTILSNLESGPIWTRISQDRIKSSRVWACVIFKITKFDFLNLVAKILNT